MRPNGENLSTSLFEYNASNSLENWRVIMQATAGAFRAKLTDLLQLAESAGFDAVEISAGKLHRLVGGYPGTNHRMPVACDVLRQEIQGTDQILSEPESGQGASLRIRFAFPREKEA